MVEILWKVTVCTVDAGSELDTDGTSVLSNSEEP